MENDACPNFSYKILFRSVLSLFILTGRYVYIIGLSYLIINYNFFLNSYRVYIYTISMIHYELIIIPYTLWLFFYSRNYCLDSRITAGGIVWRNCPLLKSQFIRQVYYGLDFQYDNNNSWNRPSTWKVQRNPRWNKKFNNSIYIVAIVIIY